MTEEEPSPDEASGDPEEFEASAAASCPIVGIGASSGGVDGLRRLLKAVDGASGLAFAIIQHIGATSDGSLAGALDNVGAMPITMIAENMAPEPDRVYVAPPNLFTRMENGRFTLSLPDKRYAHRNAIDEFFLSLADDQKSNAACIILTGTGSDGTVGLRAVKEQGGLTLAQADARMTA